MLIDNKRIFIAGAGGMLGEAFYQLFKNKNTLECSDIDLNEDWLNYLDFRNFKDYKKKVNDFKPDYLFHLGALTDLEVCERDQENAYLTNTNSVENAVNISNELNIPLLYISTAGIFDGKKDYYDDWDEGNPLSRYAKSKYQAECYVEKNSSKYLICRAGWMMGGGFKKDKKFICKIMKQIQSGNKEIFIVNDKSGTPTYTYDFAKNVDIILSNNCWGKYNLVCEGTTSRMEVAKELLKITKKDIKIIEVNSDYFKDEYFAERPRSEMLINKKLNIKKLNIMRNWKICLKEYINNSFKEMIDEH